MTLRIVLAIWLAGCLLGCGDDTTAPQDSFPASAEQVLEELQSAYRSRDIDAYSSLLAPEFVFVFQPIDAQEIATDTWTMDQDLAGTGALFGANLVSNILVDLIHAAPAIAGDEFPMGTLEIRITQTNLEVDQTDGITWLVQDIQDMYFRPGRDEEDPDRWFLIEWRDIPTTNSPYPSAGTKSVTWGKVKSLYELDP